MADILRQKEVKTRKSHICIGCNKKYPKSTSMTYVVSVDGGVVDSVYWCNTCVEYADKYLFHRDEILAGECYEYDPDGWEKLKARMEAKANGNN